MRPDALLRPVGPEPPAVYWRRRAVVVGALLLLAVVLRSCGNGGTDTTRPAGDATPGSGSARPTAGPTPTDPADRPTTPAPASTPSAAGSQTGARPSPTGTGTPPGACPAGALTVEARTDARVYPAGVRPRLTLLVRNSGAVPCRVDLGQAQRELRVVSGPDRVWSSDDCAPGGAPEPRLLAPAQQVAYAVTWSRTRSRPGCPGDGEAVRPGTYRVVGRLAGLQSAEAVFTLR